MQLRSTALLATTLAVAAYRPAVLPQQAAITTASRSAPVTMINLFGNNEESQKRRTALSFRSEQPGDRKVSFRKPNSATEGLMLGLKFREQPFTKAVFIDKIIEGTEAARLKKQGLIREGDEITMVSATFGGEMWSARGVGKYRLEKSIAVRQGMTIDFVVESPDDNSKKRQNEMAKKQKAEGERISRLQKQLTAEVEADKKKGWFNF